MSTSSEIAPVEYALVPWTGELVALANATDEQLAELLEQAREIEQDALRQLKRAVQEEILSRMDREACWTVHAGRVTLTGDSPNRSDWDVERLRKTLRSLTRSGAISSAAATKAVRRKVVYEASVSGVNALLKLGGTVAERLEECRVPSSRPRGVRVSRHV